MRAEEASCKENSICISFTVKDYFKELNLMEKQNQTEYDVYHLVYMMIRNSLNDEKVSFRDVHRRQKSSKGQVFYGLSSVPDFIIADENFEDSKIIYNKSLKKIDNIENKSFLYGCVEVKNPWLTQNLNINEIINKAKKDSLNLSYVEGQLLGELLWYKKVLYTDGLKWELVTLKPLDEELFLKNVLNTVKTRNEDVAETNWCSQFCWENFSVSDNYNSNGELNIIESRVIADLRCAYKEYKPNGDNEELFKQLNEDCGEWTKLINGLANINWHAEPVAEISTEKKNIIE